MPSYTYPVGAGPFNGLRASNQLLATVIGPFSLGFAEFDTIVKKQGKLDITKLTATAINDKK